MVKTRIKLDADEKELLASVESRGWKSVAGGKRELHGLATAVWGAILVGSLALAIAGPRIPSQSS